jgi:hypothetical protein
MMAEENIDAVVRVHLDLLKAFALAFRNQIQESKNFPILTLKACLYCTSVIFLSQ